MLSSYGRASKPKRFSCDSSWSEATANSEEDSSDSEQKLADGASIQPYQYEPEELHNNCMLDHISCMSFMTER